jgi:hypothetical protein
MNLDQAKAALATEQSAWDEVVKQPNTLERNIVLATHREEMGRLQKLIAKTKQ